MLLRLLLLFLIFVSGGTEQLTAVLTASLKDQNGASACKT